MSTATIRKLHIFSMIIIKRFGDLLRMLLCIEQTNMMTSLMDAYPSKKSGHLRKLNGLVHVGVDYSFHMFL